MLGEEHTYDAIINSVTGPIYYVAGKLFTRDFYEIVRSRLKQGGVYSVWFDLSMGYEGISIMLNTLDSVFKHCRYFLLHRGYFNSICSEEPLVYLPQEAVEERIKNSNLPSRLHSLGFSGKFYEIMRALEIDFEAQFFKRHSSNINTIDLPLMEFMLIQESDQDYVRQLLNEVIVNNMEEHKKLGVSNWRHVCNTIARMVEIPLPSGVGFFDSARCLFN